MNDVTIFRKDEFGAVRAVTLEGEPWFVAADVCRALGIDRTQTRRLDEDEKGVYSAQTPGGQQEISIVNEPGLYALVLSSRKPEAKAFKRWITHEVIPSIRKTGGYIAGQETMDDTGEKRLYDLLRRDGFVIKANAKDQNTPTQRSVDMGLMRSIERTVSSADKAFISSTTLITPKGQIYFLNKYAPEKPEKKRPPVQEAMVLC